MPVHKTADIRHAKAEGKVGIILGWQNTLAIESNIDMLRVFRDVMDQMGEIGIVVDLSHVGEKTAADAIDHPAVPVCFTHAIPRSLKDIHRNKSNDLIKRDVDRGGFFGFATYGPFLPWGDETTVESCVEALRRGVDLVGEENIGLGTDFTDGCDADFFSWLRRDKGIGRALNTSFPGRSKNPAGFDGVSVYPNLTTTVQARGWLENRIRRVMGENWLGYLERVWHG